MKVPGDPVYELIEAIIDTIKGAQDQTQSDYALCGPSDCGG